MSVRGHISVTKPPPESGSGRAGQHNPIQSGSEAGIATAPNNNNNTEAGIAAAPRIRACHVSNHNNGGALECGERISLRSRGGRYVRDHDGLRVAAERVAQQERELRVTVCHVALRGYANTCREIIRFEEWFYRESSSMDFIIRYHKNTQS